MAARSGELAMRPLPAVLLDLHDDFATGKLILKRGRVSKSVDLVNGNPVSTASTPREETLGHFLVNTGVITEAQHRSTMARAAQMGGKLGEALVAQGVITVEQLIDQLGRQARHKLVQALRWPQGAWRFDEAPAVEGMQLRMIEVVLGGLRETAVENFERLTRLEGMRFGLTPRGVRLRTDLKRSFGERAVSLLGEGSSLADIERACGDRGQARTAIDALLMCDAVEALAPSGVGLGTAERPAVADPSRTSARSPAARAPAEPALFDVLFEDLGDGGDGAAPIDFPEAEFRSEDSGVVSTAELTAAQSGGDRAVAARRTLAAEHQRVHGADHYAVLMVGRRAPVAEVDAALKVRTWILEQDAQVLTEPRDLAKLDELRQAYATARATLVDPSKRAAYDRELAGGELVQVPPAIDTELSFRMAEELMQKGQWAQAIGLIKSVIVRSPNEADYRAALGWSVWQAAEDKAEAAEVARSHLNQALEINPDHAAAHDYRGRIEAALRTDNAEALFYLERALDLDATRTEALGAIEGLLLAGGELRRYERVLKRLLFRIRGRGGASEVKAWSRLARLYLDHLDDAQAAGVAISNARRINPRDTEVAALLQRTETAAPAVDASRAGWREALADPQSGAAIVKSAEAAGHADAAFLAASAMVAMDTADARMAAVYEAHHVRGVIEPNQPLGREQWAVLRHKDDSVELGALMELVAPAIHRIAPMTLADSDLDPGQQLEEGDLPAAFARLRERFAGLLGVQPAAVYPRVELGAQIHVIACDPPVLVAGDEALTAPERPELVFRLVRAMTFLWPGRAVGASRPGRVLRAVVMAVFREASGVTVGSDDPLAGPAAEAVSSLLPQARIQARAVALRLMSRGGGLNLSLWSRALSRTADRAGLLLCGDVPTAFAGAREVGGLDRDLVEFSYSPAHVQLRTELGLSRGS